MKYIAFAFAAMISAGCMNRGSPTIEPAPFFETQARSLSMNLRDDRLFRSDLWVTGEATEFGGGSRSDSAAFWEFQLEIESAAPLQDVRILLLQGSQGDPMYVSAEIWRGQVLEGRIRLPAFDISTTNRRAALNIQFYQVPGDEATLRGRSIDLDELLNQRPNQVLQTTPMTRSEI